MYWNSFNPAQVFELWPEAEEIESSTFVTLMSAANVVCSAYAPVLSEGAVPPDNYLLAEIFQARHIWTQARGGNRDEFGPDGLSIPVYPLVFAARDLLRPKTNPLSRLR